jgi:Tol biopolymer transport system component
MRRIGAINFMSVGIFGAAVVIFMYLILIRPSLTETQGGQDQATPIVESETILPIEETYEATTETLVPSASSTAPPDIRQHIAFVMSTSEELESYALYTIEPDGSNLTLLAENAWEDPILDWSDDGSRLLFVSRKSGDYEIYAINADGTALTYWLTIPDSTTSSIYVFDGSLESSTVMYVEYDGEVCHVWATSLTNAPYEIMSIPICRFGLSPDRQVIAYQNSAQSDFGGMQSLNIFSIVMNETRSIPLYKLSEIDRLSWSPDGSKIAFFAQSDSIDPTVGLYIATMDQPASLQKLLAMDIWVGVYPTWSPNGQFIAFVGWEDGRDILYVVQSDGGNLRKVAEDVDTVWLTWSPDSTRIATTVRNNYGYSQIVVIPVDGTDGTPLTSMEADALFPVWSPRP